MILKDDKEDDDKHRHIEETTQRTKSVVKKIVSVEFNAEHPKRVQTQSQEDSKFIYYTPSKVAAFNSGTKERIVRMVEVQVGTVITANFIIITLGQNLILVSST